MAGISEVEGGCGWYITVVANITISHPLIVIAWGPKCCHSVFSSLPTTPLNHMPGCLTSVTVMPPATILPQSANINYFTSQRIMWQLHKVASELLTLCVYAHA